MSEDHQIIFCPHCQRGTWNHYKYCPWCGIVLHEGVLKRIKKGSEKNGKNRYK
jgi:hypothetical protein